MGFLQDIVGDEFKENRPGLQWMQQKLSTEEFINRIAERIQSLI